MTRSDALKTFLICISLCWIHSASRSHGQLVDFERDVAPILKSRCAECHRGAEAKNGFQVEDRDQVLGYVTPGDSLNSSLWTDYLTQPPKSKDPTSLIMPPNGPLGVGELATLKMWIDEGAVWPEKATVASIVGETKGALEPAGIPTKIYRAIGYFHPAIVHFPIVLFILSGACAGLSFFLGKRCRSMAFHMLWLGVVSSIVAAIMGWSFAEIQGYPNWTTKLSANASHDETTFYGHRWLGTSLAPLSLIVLIVAMYAEKSESRFFGRLWLLATILLSLLVGIIGHQGGELKYGDIFDKAIEQWNRA
jgi:uncharacterized membrane protein